MQNGNKTSGHSLKRIALFLSPHLVFGIGIFGGLYTKDLQRHQLNLWLVVVLVLAAALSRHFISQVSTPALPWRLLSYGTVNAACLFFVVVMGAILWPQVMEHRERLDGWDVLPLVVLLLCLLDFGASVRDTSGALRGLPHRNYRAANWSVALIAMQVVRVGVAVLVGLVGAVVSHERDGYDDGYEDGQAAGRAQGEQ